MNHHQPQAQTVSAVGLKRYNGPLGQFLEKQAAATLHAARNTLTGLLEDCGVFSEEECRRCVANAEQCTCLAQLQRWFRNTYRVRTERLLAQAAAQRTERGRTADYAAELAHSAREAEFTAETGLSYTDLLSL